MKRISLKKLDSKGFTLIELLAVIVILGILMIVAIPMVTKYIDQSRKDTFADTAKAYINAARYAYLNEGLGGTCQVGMTATVPITNLDVENTGKSPYGGTLVGSVTVTPDTTTGKYTYTITLQDSAKKIGITDVPESSLGRDSVVKVSSTVTTPAALACS